MALDQQTYELIDQYLRGELVGQDLDKFKIRLKDDADFLKQVQLQKGIIEAIEARRTAELKAVLKKAQSSPRPNIVPIKTRYLAVAASILSLLAFGLIIKTLLPQQQPEFVEDTTPVLDTDSSENLIVLGDSPPPPESLIEPTQTKIPERSADIVVAEVEDDTALIALADDVTEEDLDEATMTDNNAKETTSLDELKKAEDKLLLATDVKTQSDSLIGVGYITAYTITVPQKTTLDSEATTRRQRRKQKEAAEASVQAPQKVKSADVKIEYWHSIVGSTKVKFDGKTLVVFEEPNRSNYSILRYNGAHYLKKNQTYYHLPISNSFAGLKVVTDTKVLEILNK